ncbi:hypothetical protein GCM10027598_84130 [Amycolatopsis oliviviridis]|uniref:Uncharacterized protein n=1 Tax=Amycolatopsis oliviviridis TaxID=1471590 RepID=A0ABQ3L7Z7_9PSEU|nr:hypothetical protein GCM10017790_14030 [Amycolatopsis oliviviridis]
MGYEEAAPEARRVIGGAMFDAVPTHSKCHERGVQDRICPERPFHDIWRGSAAQSSVATKRLTASIVNRWMYFPDGAAEASR